MVSYVGIKPWQNLPPISCSTTEHTEYTETTSFVTLRLREFRVFRGYPNHLILNWPTSEPR